MTFNLGIDIGDDRVTAAYERSGTMRLVTFGPLRATPLRVHIGANGEVSTGHDAEQAAKLDPDGNVSNVLGRFAESKSVVVNGYAITGETLLAHVLSAVIDKAEAQAEAGPVGRVAVAHPATWTAPTRAALSGALAQIGLADAEVTLGPQAATQAPESARNLPEQAPALGAAVLAARRARSSGTGTRSGRTLSTRPTPPIPTDAPTSVFDPTNPDATNRPAAAGIGNAGRPVGSGAGALAGAAAAGGATLGGGGSSGGPPRDVAPFGDESDDDGSPPWTYLAAGAALLVLVVVLGILVLGRGDGESTVQATGPTGPSASTTSSSTTSTSTVVESTSTTTSTTTTSTTTTIPATTTTTTPRAIGKIALSEVGLILDFGTGDSTTVVFGDAADGALSAIRARAGSITNDTGWTENSFCTGVMTRRVHFADLEVVFSADEEENETFEQWFVDSPGTRPMGLVSLDRLGIGSTLADFREVYGNLLRVSQPSGDADEGLFTTGQSERFMDGVLSGVQDTSKVQQIWAGSACQRVPD